MKAPPFNDIEIEVLGKNTIPRRQQAKKDQHNDSISSELSLDLLLKDRSEASNSSLQLSSGSCRWNPEDSDYSLNILLAPQRVNSPKTDNDSTSTVLTSISTNASSLTPNDSLSTISSSHLLGSDYSLSCMRVRPRVLDASSHHSVSSVDTLDTDFSIRSKAPQNNIEAQKPKTSKKKPSSVQFFPRVRILRVPPRKTIPAQQMEDVWYSREEFEEIRQECFKTIRLMREDEDATDEEEPLCDEDDRELCRRGLEYKTPKAYKRRQKQKKDLKTVIFDELDFQEEQGLDDPIWLAKLSRDQSRACVATAIEAAREDERQARSYLNC